MLPTRRLSSSSCRSRRHGDHIDGSHLAEALTDALTVELGKLPGATVIAYEIARWHQTGRDHLRVIREDLQVRYAAEGSIGARRLTGCEHPIGFDRIWRSALGRSLWTSTTRTAADQEAIVHHLSAILKIAVSRAESIRSQRERPGNLDAVDLVVRAQALSSEHSLQRCAEAHALFEQALALDPQSLPAIVGLAHAMLVMYADRGYYWLDGGEPERLARLISDAQAIAPNDEAVLVCTAVWLERQGRYEAAMAVARRIIQAHPRNANGYVRLARSKIFCGEAEDAIPLLEKAIQLDPYEPHLFDRYWRLGFALLLAQRERDAVQWLQRSLGARLDGPAQLAPPVGRVLCIVGGGRLRPDDPERVRR